MMKYIQLTKPRIMLLIVASGAIAIFMEGSLRGDFWGITLILLAVYLTGGSANSFNQYFERDLDAKMTRTSRKRMLPQKKISPTGALIFSITIGIAGVLIFGLVFNWLSAIISLISIVYYSFFYTLWLKPNTDQSVVIGGFSGAIVPVGAWVAASGEMALTPWLLFLIVFMWTPPHFWALAIRYKEDYIESGLPMMPNTRGDIVTSKQIFYYTILMVASSFALYFTQAGLIYLVFAFGFGFLFLKKSYYVLKDRNEQNLKSLFSYSIMYLFLLFLSIVVDDYLVSYL